MTIANIHARRRAPVRWPWLVVALLALAALWLAHPAWLVPSTAS